MPFVVLALINSCDYLHSHIAPLLSPASAAYATALFAFSFLTRAAQNAEEGRGKRNEAEEAALAADRQARSAVHLYLNDLRYSVRFLLFECGDGEDADL